MADLSEFPYTTPEGSGVQVIARKMADDEPVEYCTHELQGDTTNE